MYTETAPSHFIQPQTKKQKRKRRKFSVTARKFKPKGGRRAGSIMPRANISCINITHTHTHRDAHRGRDYRVSIHGRTVDIARLRARHVVWTRENDGSAGRLRVTFSQLLSCTHCIQHGHLNMRRRECCAVAPISDYDFE